MTATSQTILADEAAHAVDQGLEEIASAYDFLVYVSPTNAEEQWQEYVESDVEPSPSFSYRPLPFDGSRLRRLLFNLPVEDVDDPDLRHVFEEKREELSRQISLLEERGSKKFKPGAIQLYGAPERPLVELAEATLSATASCVEPGGACLDAEGMAARARREVSYYQAINARFDARVEVAEDVVAGMMVSKNAVLVAHDASFSESRVDALMQHEIGTHLVTFFNGEAQPLRIFRAGLAGYEPLQEGLAVIAEWVSGGLRASRLRTLAARVIAVDAMCRDADFAETFRLLTDGWGFPAHGAFRIVTRVYRGGGLPKDAIYLEGFRDLLRRLKKSSDWRPLFVGKIALGHLPLVERLLERGVLRPPLFEPRYLTRPGARDELDRCAGLSIPEIVKEICA